MARLIQVIETEVTHGQGTEVSPVRIVRQWWTPEGDLLCERDDWFEDRVRTLVARRE